MGGLDGPRLRTYDFMREDTYVTAKLTLSVDARVIADAKRYAAEAGTSVSQLVEDYLAAIAARPTPEPPPPVLARLRGCLHGVDIEDFRRHQVEKYSR